MKYPTLFTIALSMSSAAFAANCAPEQPATCYPDTCCRSYCLGPDNVAINAPVRPYTCNGDWSFTLAAFYWNAHQDGMEYAIDNAVQQADNDAAATQLANSSIVSASYETPSSKWEYGFKLGLGYNTTCDGWDFRVLWTNYHGKANSHIEAENDDNHTLLPLWSNFNGTDGAADPTFVLPVFATDIEAKWNLNLDLIDFELGRDFWSGRKVALRPHIGLRFANIRQNYEIDQRGGSWSEPAPRLNNEVDIDNNFKGIGMRSGLDTLWTLGCGWSIYGDTAVSLVYGRFNIDHDETNRQASTSFTKDKFFETTDSFRASRLMLDFGIGLQWSALFCDCDYKLKVNLGWENHLFLDQNQMWRVVKVTEPVGTQDTAPSGITLANIFHQRRGDLDTQGWTLTVELDF